MTFRARHVVGSLRRQLVYQSLREALWRQSRRLYAPNFHVVDFSIQNDHVHLLVEGQDPNAADERDILRRGLTGLASSLARLINKALERRGAVWADRHHRRDLSSPTEVRRALLYVLHNFKRHGVVVFGSGVIDPYSSASRFTDWSEAPCEILPEESWPPALARTWLLRIGWKQKEGPLEIRDAPTAVANLAPIVQAYLREPHSEVEVA